MSQVGMGATVTVQQLFMLHACAPLACGTEPLHVPMPLIRVLWVTGLDPTRWLHSARSRVPDTLFSSIFVFCYE